LSLVGRPPAVNELTLKHYPDVAALYELLVRREERSCDRLTSGSAGKRRCGRHVSGHWSHAVRSSLPLDGMRPSRTHAHRSHNYATALPAAIHRILAYFRNPPVSLGSRGEGYRA
jgi:hypothetical protein